MRQSQNAEGHKRVINLESPEREPETACEPRSNSQIVAAQFVFIARTELQNVPYCVASTDSGSNVVVRGTNDVRR